MLIYLLSFTYSAVVGVPFVGYVSRQLWVGMGWSGESDAFRPHPEHPQMVGVAERILYTGSWLSGHPEFIAVWLALKVAGQWTRWSDTTDVNGKVVAGRAVFNTFLLGNAFSIGFGVIGALLAGWLDQEMWLISIVTASALPILCIVFGQWARAATQTH